jgi:hypothetical protein
LTWRYRFSHAKSQAGHRRPTIVDDGEVDEVNSEA